MWRYYTYYFYMFPLHRDFLSTLHVFFAEFEDFFVWFEELHVGTFFLFLPQPFSLYSQKTT